MEVYTVKEVAKKLKIHEITTYLLIEEGKLKCIRIGRNIRVPEQFLNDFILTGTES